MKKYSLWYKIAMGIFMVLVLVCLSSLADECNTDSTEAEKTEEIHPLDEITVIGELKALLNTDLERSELPRSVEGIGRDFMDTYGVDTLQDAVMRLSGVMPAIEGIYGRRNEDIMIRGQQYNPVLKNGFVMPIRGYLVNDTAKRPLTLKLFEVIETKAESNKLG